MERNCKTCIHEDSTNYERCRSCLILRNYDKWKPKEPTEEKRCTNCRQSENCSFAKKHGIISCFYWKPAEPTEQSVYTATEAMVNKVFDEALKIVQDRNKRYGDAWKYYRTGTYIDRILVKAMRLQQMDLHGDPIPDLRECFLDIINECAFGVIKLGEWDEGGNKVD